MLAALDGASAPGGLRWRCERRRRAGAPVAAVDLQGAASRRSVELPCQRAGIAAALHRRIQAFASALFFLLFWFVSRSPTPKAFCASNPVQ